MWIPDVYHGAPTAVTLVIGSAPKLAAFAMAVRMLINGLPDLAHDWQEMLALMALLSMAIGNITAIAQSNLKRMLAYSTIAHMGFMLLGLLSGVVILIGWISFTRLPVDLMPDVSFPSITVRVGYAGVGPLEMEELVTRPL